MSTEGPSNETLLSPDSELDESSITSSLSRLQEMHVALRNLRGTIPRVMDSVLVDPLAPEQFHSLFAQAARRAASDIKSFAHTMEDSRSKDVMEKARESRAKNREDITGWLVTEHEDWLDMKQDGASEDVDLEGRGSDAKVTTADGRTEDLQAALRKYRESHPGVDVSLEDGTKTVKIYLPPPAHIHFEVHPSTEGVGNYELHTKEKTKLHNAILEAISTRPKPKELDTLLARLHRGECVGIFANVF